MLGLDNHQLHWVLKSGTITDIESEERYGFKIDDYVRLNASGLTLIPGILVYRSGWARNSLRMCLSPFFWPRFLTWPAYHHIRLSTHQLIPTAQSQHFRRNACRRRRGKGFGQLNKNR